MTEKLKAYWTSWGNGNINSAQTILENSPELVNLFTTMQSTSDHAEGTVAKHTILTCEAANEIAQKLSQPYNKILRYAALLHDVGKPKSSEEAAPGIFTFPNHYKNSFTLARIILERYTYMPIKEKEHILALINNHGYPIWLVENQFPIRILRKLSMECHIELLHKLSMANFMGRKAPNLRYTFEELEVFKSWSQEQNLWGEKIWEGLMDISCFARFGKNAKVAKSAIDWFYLTEQISDNMDAQIMLANKRNDWVWGTLYMTVGPPGSGKSTWISKNYPMMPLISTDQIRIELTGNIANQEHNDKVYELALSRIKDYLSQGKQVVYDATNLKYANRKQIIDLARHLGAHIVVIFFNTTYDNCLARLKNRKILPLTKEVLDEMYENFDYVSPYEYDKIICVN